MSLPSAKRFISIAAAGAIFLSTTAFSFETNGDIDAGFDAGKITNGQVQAAVVQPDKMVVIAGGFGKVNNVARRNIARLDPSGTLDPTFDPLGGTDGTIGQLILQGDGKLLIVGAGSGAGGGSPFFSVNGTPRNNLARLNSNGSLDTTFDPGRLISADGVVSGGVAVNPGSISQIVVQADGKIVVLGQFAAVATGATTSTPRSCVARFNSDGTFDASYDPGTGMTNAAGTPSAVYGVLQSSGKIVVAGPFDHFNGSAVAGFARLNTDGSYDASFNAGTGTDFTTLGGLFAQSDDKIVVFGQLNNFNGIPCNEMTRLLVDGAVDGGFTTGKFQNFDYQGIIEAVAQQPDGKLLVGGTFYSIDNVSAGAVVRLQTDGSRDTTFDASGTKNAGEVLCFAKRPTDDEYYIGGYFSAYGGDPRNNITLVGTTGLLDNTFLPSGATDFSPEIFSVLAQPDGKIIVGGLFSSVNGHVAYNLVRLLPDGGIDTGFGTTFGMSRSVRAMATQSTGKIIVVGSFYAADGTARGHVARLNTDGTLDLSFDPGTGTDNIVYAVAVDTSDNIYIGGAFTAFNGTTRHNLAKLQPNGALDSTFDPGTGTGGISPDVRAIAPPSGSAGPVIAGFFTTYAGTTVNRIVRVDAGTAARDTAFTTASGTAFNSAVRALTLKSDGKYYAAGSFSSFSGSSRPRLARLNADGSLDTGFVPSPTLNTTARALIEQNGKIDVAGSFTSPGNQLVRYSSTGPRDTTLNTGTGIAGADLADIAILGIPEIDSLALQPDGKMLVGGIFSSYSGVTRYGLVRLTNSHLRILSIFPFSGHIRITGVGDPVAFYNLQGSPDLNPLNFQTLNSVQTDGNGNWTFDDLNSGSFTRRFYRAAFQ